MRAAAVVEVWTAVPSAPVLRPLVTVLDAHEQDRAARLGDASDRFVLGRVLLRCALAVRLGCPPGGVGLRAVCPRCGGPHGRVLVTGPWSDGGGGPTPAPLHVSVTRSGPLVAVAVTSAGPVGIDVESLARVRAAPLADVALSPDERDAHRRLRVPGARSRALARAWVRKEAALKALGTGLTTEPASLDLAPPRSRIRRADDVAGGPLAVVDLRLPGLGRVGAVAVAHGADVGPAPAGGAHGRVTVRRYDGAALLNTLRS